MTRVNAVVLMVGFLVAGAPAGNAGGAVRNFATVMKVILNNLSELDSMRIDAPTHVRIGKTCRLQLVANIPEDVANKLESEAGFDLAKEIKPGRETELGEFAPVLKIAAEPALGVNAGKCSFGFRERDAKYEVVWTVTALPKQRGVYSAKLYFDSNSDVNPATIEVSENLAAVMAQFWVEVDRPATFALLWIAFAVLLIASDVWLILAAGAVGVGLCTRFGLGGTIVAAVVSIIVVVVNHISEKSLVRAALARFAPEDATGAEKAVGIDQLHGRAERMATEAMRRAHLALGAGIIAAVAAAIVLFPLYGVVTDLADADADSSPVKLVGASLPWLLLFASLMIGTRWFLTQYRQSLEDHRHFEEKLRDRELVRFVLTGAGKGLSDEFKKLLLSRVASEAAATTV